MGSRPVLLGYTESTKKLRAIDSLPDISELSSAAGRRLTLALPLGKPGSVERLLTTGADSAGIRCRLPRILTGVSASTRTSVYDPRSNILSRQNRLEAGDGARLDVVSGMHRRLTLPPKIHRSAQCSSPRQTSILANPLRKGKNRATRNSGCQIITPQSTLR